MGHHPGPEHACNNFHEKGNFFGLLLGFWEGSDEWVKLHRAVETHTHKNHEKCRFFPNGTA